MNNDLNTAPIASQYILAGADRMELMWHLPCETKWLKQAWETAR